MVTEEVEGSVLAEHPAGHVGGDLPCLLGRHVVEPLLTAVVRRELTTGRLVALDLVEQRVETVDEIASAVEPLFHRGDSGDSVVLTGFSALAGSGVLTRHDVS